MMVLLILLMLLCLPQLTAAQTIHYASPGGSTNAASCPQNAPCSLDRATALATAGHTVRLLNGTYNQVWNSARNGTVANPITFEAANRHQAIIRWNLGNVFNQLWDIEHDNIIVRGLQLNGTGPNGSSFDLLRVEGASEANPAENILIEDVWGRNAGHNLFGTFNSNNVTLRHSSFDLAGLVDNNGECLYLSSANSYKPVRNLVVTRNVFTRCNNNLVDYKGQAFTANVHHNIFKDFVRNPVDNSVGDGLVRSVLRNALNNNPGNIFADNITEDAVAGYVIRLQGNRVDVLRNVFDRLTVSPSPFIDNRTEPTGSPIIRDNVVCNTPNMALGAATANTSNNNLSASQAVCDAEKARILSIPVLASCSIGTVNASTVVGVWNTQFQPVHTPVNARFAVTCGGAGQTETGTTAINNQSRTTLGANCTAGQTVQLSVQALAIENSGFFGGFVVDNNYGDYNGNGVNGRNNAQGPITCTNSITGGGDPPPPPPPAGMVAHWRLDEVSGSTTAADSEGSNTGTLTNMNAATAWDVGVVNGSLGFDGINDFVAAGSTQLIDTDAAWSVNLWVKLNNFNNTAPGQVMIATDVGQGFQVLASTADAGFAPITFGTSSGTVQRRISTDFSPDLINTWNHIVVVFNGGTKTTAGNYVIYRNAASQAHVASGTIAALGNINTLGKNGTATTNQMDGRLDDVRVYNFALSEAEVTALFQTGTIPPPPPDPDTGVPYHLNAGGPDFTATGGQLWVADREWVTAGFGYNSVTGATGSTTNPVAGTVDDELFQTYRFGEFSYLFPVPNGTYNLTLYFLENAWETIGSRVFTVSVEGVAVPALTNYDIYADVGVNTASVKNILGVEVSDGLLNIDFVPSASTARVSAIQVVKAAGEPGVTEVFTATDDAYICEIPATCGRGNGHALAIRHTALNEFRPILKFNLSSISFSSVSSAILELNAIALSNTTTVQAFAAANDNWSEAAVNWTNAPALGAQAASVSVSALGQVSLDVTSLVSAQVAGDKVVTIYLRDDATTGNTVLFDAKESGFPAATLSVVQELP